LREPSAAVQTADRPPLNPGGADDGELERIGWRLVEFIGWHL
jgi:hypothetical protein